MGNCAFLDKGDVTPEILERLGFSFGEIYMSPRHIESAALAVQEENRRSFAVIPFCHTVEAKALGGDIFPGDDTAGPRAGSYIYRNLDELKLFPIADAPDVTRLAQACRDLNAGGAKTAWTVTGPISTLSCLVPIEQIFKTWRKDPERMSGVLTELSGVLLGYAKTACDAGANRISYADPAGNLDILGPKNSAFMSEHFTLPFLQNALELCGENTQLSICPLTAEALTKADCPIPSGVTCCCIKRI